MNNEKLAWFPSPAVLSILLVSDRISLQKDSFQIRIPLLGNHFMGTQYDRRMGILKMRRIVDPETFLENYRKILMASPGLVFFLHAGQCQTLLGTVVCRKVKGPEILRY